jgi:N-acetylneuraminate synthase
MKKKPFITIGKRKIGEDYPPFVIAEIGINHEGSMAKAKRMIRDAKKAGAECVKFQSHVIDDEMIPEAKKVIPGNAKESIWNIMARCAFNEKQERELKRYTEKLGMLYLCTPFSRAASDRLARMKVVAYKIGSGECNNYPLLEHIAKRRKPMIISTGMNDVASVRPVVKIMEKYKTPYALLHVTSMYPTPYEKVRLGALAELKKAFPRAVLGLSDHSIGNYTCFGAVALGASILEKHFTSDVSWPGPDVPISITPPELKELIEGSSAIHRALGGTKRILKEEQPTIDFAYATVVTVRPVKEGAVIRKDDVWVKRPGTGEILAKDLNKIIGKKAKHTLKAHTHVRWHDIV